MKMSRVLSIVLLSITSLSSCEDSVETMVVEGYITNKHNDMPLGSIEIRIYKNEKGDFCLSCFPSFPDYTDTTNENGFYRIEIPNISEDYVYNWRLYDHDECGYGQQYSVELDIKEEKHRISRSIDRIPDSLCQSYDDRYDI